MKVVPASSYQFSWGKRLLLVGGSEIQQNLRASILRSRGLEVEVACDLAGGRSLWQPNIYDWILLDIHDQLPGEAIDFCEQIKRADPGQRIAFLVGPPTYVSLNWPDEIIAEAKRQKQQEALKAAA